MAMLDNISQSRDALPSINHLDLDKIKTDRGDTSRFPIMSGLNIQTASLGSPTTMYSGPPPPYSCAASNLGSAQGLSGYISPPESTTRRSLRDEKESPSAQKSLPSIHEALGDKTMMPTTLSHPQSQISNSTPNTFVGQSFPDAPRGPINPFSQSTLPAPISKEVNFTQPTTVNTSYQEHIPSKQVQTPKLSSDPGPFVQQKYQYPVSPRPSLSAAVGHSRNPISNLINAHDSPIRPPYQAEQVSHGHNFSEYPAPSTTTSISNHNPSSFHFESNGKFDDSRNPFVQNNPPGPYQDTVKRHLDIYDAELSLNEISEGSTRTLDFSRFWGQKFHQSNRSNAFAEGVPTVHEIEDMMRQSQRVMENLGRIRDLVIMQQTAISEERARAARNNHVNDDYHNLSDNYKVGGFAQGDAKKRRGKAAPPGRCHSCNRAETPEWRRGPDGARTLCNACGLHYAKLTRKVGANKAGALSGSSLRPKSLDTRP